MVGTVVGGSVGGVVGEDERGEDERVITGGDWQVPVTDVCCSLQLSLDIFSAAASASPGVAGGPARCAASSAVAAAFAAVLAASAAVSASPS